AVTSQPTGKRRSEYTITMHVPGLVRVRVDPSVQIQIRRKTVLAQRSFDVCNVTASHADLATSLVAADFSPPRQHFPLLPVPSVFVAAGGLFAATASVFSSAFVPVCW